jgi:hypothetical protein
MSTDHTIPKPQLIVLVLVVVLVLDLAQLTLAATKEPKTDAKTQRKQKT